VRLWARGELKPDHDETEPDEPAESSLQGAAAAFGLVVVGHMAAGDAERFWLWPETIPFWNAWQQVQARWQYASLGLGGAMRTGLDQLAVESWLRAQGWGHGRRRSLRRALLAIQSAEEAALSEWAEQAARERH
jgi:hypothetical protein